MTEESTEKKDLRIFLTKDAILKKEDLVIEEVFVPEWGGHVYVKTMSGRERDEYEVSIWAEEVGKKTMENFRAKLACQTVCDKKGNLLFTLDEAPRLARKSSKALDRIFSVATRLNKITKRDQDELLGNLEGDQS